MSADWSAWIGKTEDIADLAAPGPVRLMSATLERRLEPGAAMPPLWHWLYFLPAAPRSQVGPDGHPARGGFLPPVALPRRMWAGGRLAFHSPVFVGQALRRRSCIESVSGKQGRSGSLVFVKVAHEIHAGETLAIREEQDIVYRDAPQARTPAPSPPMARLDHDYAREFHPDPVLLFRYSALTFNGHRIHYDQPYATAVEGYPGLVVHGPLIATLLLEQLQRERPNASVRSFEFRAVSPLFVTEPFWLCGRIEDSVARLWASARDGRLAMDATAHLSP